MLVDIVTEQEIDTGAIYLVLTRVRKVSHAIVVAVCNIAIDEKLTDTNLPDDLENYIQSLMYEPDY